MAKDKHVPQNEVSPESVVAFVERIRAIGAEDWTALLARTLTVREDWDHATAELEESDAEPGPNDGPWNPWHLLNHVGGVTACAGEHLRAVAAGEKRSISPAERWQGDSVSFTDVRSGCISGWDEFVAAVTESTIAQPDDASATHPRFGELNARELVAFVLLHMQDHVRQMREVRGLAADENPGDSAGDLGRRRQTAH